MLAKLMTILTIFIILIVAGTAGYLVSSYFLKSTSTTSSYKILETRDFSCPGMTGFTFKYPVFEGWEPYLNYSNEDRCVINFQKPSKFDSIAVSSIKVEKIAYNGVPNLSSAKNPQNIFYTTLSGVEGYAFVIVDYRIVISFRKQVCNDPLDFVQSIPY